MPKLLHETNNPYKDKEELFMLLQHGNTANCTKGEGILLKLKNSIED